ncbi:MAG: NAD-dependent epimerase/dehydratase family protein [bacterium]
MKKPNFDKKNVLVTGGAGFIGSHLCNALIKDSFVICVDDLSGGSEKNIDHLLSLDNFRFINHNLNEKLALEERKELGDVDLRFQGIQEIYHLAAITTPKDFEKKKLEIYDTNILATRNALDMAVNYGSKFVFASSSVVYGKRPDNNTFFQEDYFGYVDQISERACYDEGKRAAESLVSIYKEKFSLDVRIARLFRIYGTKMKLSDGHMLPDFVFNALEGKDLVIHGDENFATSLCYVSDIVEALIKMADMENDIGPVNLGSDQDYKLSFIARKIIEIAKEFSSEAKNAKIVYDKPLLFMSPLGLPSITKAKEQLGWLPIVTLEKGLRNMVDYVMANKNVIDFREDEI